MKVHITFSPRGYWWEPNCDHTKVHLEVSDCQYPDFTASTIKLLCDDYQLSLIEDTIQTARKFLQKELKKSEP